MTHDMRNQSEKQDILLREMARDAVAIAASHGVDVEAGQTQEAAIVVPVHLSQQLNARRTSSYQLAVDQRRVHHHHSAQSYAPQQQHRSSSLFLRRKGKEMSWENVNMKVAPKSSKLDDKHILSNVWGGVPAKTICAVMGPSGSGKTSLLKILAGRATSRGKIHIDGCIRLDGSIVDPTDISIRRQIAFIEQENSLPATSTPREAIRFSARLRLDRNISDTEINKIVDEILSELGLEDCADTLLGGGLIKGVSGGEMKRTSVGVELVVRPTIIVFDEPTSALDSYTAEQLVKTLKRVAAAGSACLFTIHQPPSAVFNLFDHLILLNKGRVMYSGEASEAQSYFSQRGYPSPPNYNPADWMLSIAQRISDKNLEHAGFYPESSHSSQIRQIEVQDDIETGISNEHSSTASIDTSLAADTNHVLLGTEIVLLFQREMKKIFRDKASLVARFGISIFFNILFGCIFYQVGTKDPSLPVNLQGHFGAIVNLLISCMMGVAQASLLSFPSERPIFLREYSTNHYRVGTYFLSRLSIEATITFLQIFVQTLISYFLIGLQMGFFLFTAILYVLAMASVSVGVLIGSWTEDPKVASEMMPILIVPQCMFAGFFIATNLIPEWLRWAQYLCSLTYSVRIALLAEFGDCTAASCQGLLESNSVREIESYWYWLILVALFVGFRVAAMLVLKRRATFH